jgi:hypothetical protein
MSGCSARRASRSRALSIFAFGLAVIAISILWFAFLEKASLGFRKLDAKVVSMYDNAFLAA